MRRGKLGSRSVQVLNNAVCRDYLCVSVSSPGPLFLERLTVFYFSSYLYNFTEGWNQFFFNVWEITL